MSLSQLAPGTIARVQNCALEPGDEAYLRALGLAPLARLRVCRLGEPCVVELLSDGEETCDREHGCCRIGLSKALAKQVMVQRLEDHRDDAAGA
jgi:Fe2+ transport system protein FeoA